MGLIPIYDECFMPAYSYYDFQKYTDPGHKYAFQAFCTEKTEYDPYSLIKEYMTNSNIRREIDYGWGHDYYLQAQGGQILGSVNLSDCDKRQPGRQYDTQAIEWMGGIYNRFQWMYSIPSAEIVKRIPPEELTADYKELSFYEDKEVCEKLLQEYFPEMIEKNVHPSDIVSSKMPGYEFLSSMYEREIIVNDIAFKNVLTAYLSFKLPDNSIPGSLDKPVKKEDFAKLSVEEAVELTDNIQDAGTKYTWEAFKIEHMIQTLEIFYDQNEDLRQALLNTGDSYIQEEFAWKDTAWVVKGNNLTSL